VGKGKRVREARKARMAWSVAEESRRGLRWRADLMELLRDEDAHRSREFHDHMTRLRQAGQIMHDHTADRSSTFEEAWMSFCRPAIRLAFASGIDVTGITWHHGAPTSEETPEGIVQFVMDAIDADRRCDLTALKGELFVVSPEVHLVIAACAASMSAREIQEAFVDGELPAPAGMILLPDRAPWVSFPHTRAMTWQRLPEVVWNTGEKYAIPTMRMKSYVHTSVFHHIVAPGQRYAVTKDTLLPSGDRDIEPCLGELTEAHADDFVAMLAEAVETRLASDEFISNADQLGRRATREEGTEIGEARLDRDPAIPMTMAAYMAAFARVVDQEIVTAEPGDRETTGEGRARVRADDDEIQILRLRRTVEVGGQPVKSVNWSHRWVVQMHKVRQWYPTLGRHKTIWRGPYVKGPAGAPLKLPKERVHGVVR
jgi:hypothetical protein